MFKGKLIATRNMRALCVLLASVFVFLSLVVLLSPEKALGNVLQYTRLTYVTGSANLSYTRHWGDSGEGSVFSQGYNVGAGGFFIDPRLAKFTFGTNFSYGLSSGDEGEDNWLTGINMNVSMFNMINRNRGPKLWRYVPSPVVFGYTYTLTDDHKQHNYNFGFTIVRYGFIRFFGPKGIIYYEEGAPKVHLDAHRYRRKFNDETLNYNRNGNGNWNRNGNGNWNRNGNGNWNRNGNGNWNGNGNGNWNADSNSGFRDRIRPRRPFGFRFPSIFYNLSGMSIEFDDKEPADALVSMLRAISTSKERDRHGTTTYSSQYSFLHRYYESNGEKTLSRIRVDAQNEWQRLFMTNWYEKSFDHGMNESQASSRLRWYDSIGKYSNYNIGASADYRDINGNATTSYSMNAGIGSGASKRVVLSPKLTSISRINGSFSLSASKSENSDTVVNSGWGLAASERLDSTHIDWLLAYSSLNTGYRAAGIPLNFVLGGTSRGLKKISFLGSYTYSTFMYDNDEPKSVTQTVRFETRYQFRYNINGFFKVDRSSVSSENKGDSGSTGWSAGLNWRPSYRSSLNTTTKNTINDNSSEAHELLTVYRQGLSRGTSLFASLEWRWKEEISNRREVFILAYSWKYRQVSMQGDYSWRKATNGDIKHKIHLAVSRSFGRRLRIF